MRAIHVIMARPAIGSHSDSGRILGKIMTLPGSAVVLNHLRLSSFHLSHNLLSLGSRILSIKLHERL